MGTYYNIDDVKANGKRLFSRPHSTRGQLVAICDRGLFELAVDVTGADEYDEFHNQYSQGLLLTFSLYDYTPTASTEDA